MVLVLAKALTASSHNLESAWPFLVSAMIGAVPLVLI
jgi:hypothetical protein